MSTSESQTRRRKTNGGTAKLDHRRELPKAPSGIAGLDEITGGGLPRGRPTLVCGGAGCGKTLFAMEFLVRGATQFGESGVFIMSREILPNIMGPIIVELTVRIGYAIFTVSTLSFLGVGIQRPSPDWGLAISDGRDLLRANIWWPITFPALAIATLVVGVNLIADSIQSVYDR